MILENESLRVELDDSNGAIVAVFDKIGGIDLITEQRLAENFRLLLPMPEMQANYVLGLEQAPPAIDQTDKTVTFHWAGPLTNERGEYDLDVTLRVELLAESVAISCRVHNGTPYELAEVWFAMIGGMTGLAPGDAGRNTMALLPEANKLWQKNLFADFGNTRGQTLGIHTGEHGFFYPGVMSMPWMSFYDVNQNRGLYIAALERTARVKMIRLALEPGMAEHRVGGNWPRKEEVGDLPLGLVMNWTHFPYTKPGDTFESASAVLQFHDGDWRDSAALYRRWFDEQYEVVKPGSTWIRRATAFFHPMCMLPEDNVNFTFKDIPRWAKSAVDHGVNSFMFAGWDRGGHDRGYPYYEPDPRLGTWDELRDGIQACHDMGMKVSFFVNCQPIDMTTDWYKKELHKYRILDPNGVQYYIINCWGMGTLSARSLFLGGTPFTEMNPAHPQVRELLIRQWRKLVEIGADGLHIDKFFQTPMDFNPLLKDTSPDRAHHEGILKFVEELFAECRAINPEFCISFEGMWDRLFTYTDTLWWGNGETSALKAAFPQVSLVCGIEQPYDFNKLNHAVLEGQNLLVGPGNYTKSMDYGPIKELADYIGEVTRIREELFDSLCMGEKLDASHGPYKRRDAFLEVDGSFARSPHARWCLYRDVGTGKRAVILANLAADTLKVTDLAIADNHGGECRVVQPFEVDRQSTLPISLSVPGERVAFIVEQ